MTTLECPSEYRWGAISLDSHTTEFRVWAPRCRQLVVEIDCDGSWSRHPLRPDGIGNFTGTIAGVGPGARYLYRLNDGAARPDPRSRWQPTTVHDASQVVDANSYTWHDQAWRGIRKHELIIYELHVGTLTPSGTFRGAIECIPEWLELGITAIELLPIAQTPGRWNWGYDGVNLFAVRNSYGTLDEFKALVDACHQHGIAVILDVVYNHLGPEGNYLSEFAPYFTDRHHTPWGSALNYDGPDSQPVRNYILANAWQWLIECHVDGLRLDAAHFMFDDSQPNILQSLRAAVDGWQKQLNRPLYLIAETNVYDPHAVAPLEQGGQGIDAVWCDDLMHSLLSMSPVAPRLTHRVYQGASDVARCLKYGHIYQYRKGPDGHEYTRSPDEPQRVDNLSSLVVGIQTHDSVGNHPLGRRIHHLSSVHFQRGAAACMLLYPSLPILFMGEEFAATAPFLFFVDFHDQRLRRTIERNRRQEYPDHDWDAAISPIDDQAFWSSQRGRLQDGDRGMWDWYRALLRLRKAWQAEGTLASEHLHQLDTGHHDLFVWTYHPPHSRPAYVAVRLNVSLNSGPPSFSNTAPPLASSIILRLSEPPDLNSVQTGSPQSGTATGVEFQLPLALNQVVAGRGTITWQGFTRG